MSRTIERLIQKANKKIQLLPWKSIFQRLPGISVILLILISTIGPFVTPTLFSLVYLLLLIINLENSIKTAFSVYKISNLVKVHSCTDWVKKYCEETGARHAGDLVDGYDVTFDDVHHVIILPNYKEDGNTLKETLNNLASHCRALTSYTVCLAMEQAEGPLCEEKARLIITQYSSSFKDVVYTIHPCNIEGEVRGKSSNVAWASREMTNYFGIHKGHVVMTVMDADTAFAEDYFMAINHYFAVEKKGTRDEMMFCAPTLFDRNANDVPLLVRVNDVLWSIAVISNMYPSSAVKIPCSAYSVSMALAEKVKFWDSGPDAIGEDLHMYLKCFF